MWAVENQSPFSASGSFARDKEGEEFWVIAVRARFRAADNGLVEICETQPDVRLLPQYADDKYGELASESDFAPFRQNTDVILSGRACAKDLRRVVSQPISLRVGKLSKSAIAVGERIATKRSKRWSFGSPWVVEDPDPFQETALTWRNALGGIDLFARSPQPHPMNPIGRGWTLHPRDAGDDVELSMPRIENPSNFYRIDSVAPDPVGFGPIQPAWRPRIDNAGTFDDAWRKGRAPLLPHDFSSLFYQSVSSDQIYPGSIVGGEEVSINGLSPLGRFSFRLPQVVLQARTLLGHERIASRFKIISVDINGTERTVDIVWNSAIACTGADHLVEKSSLRIKQMSGVRR